MGSKMHLNQIKHGEPLHYSEDTRSHTKEYAQLMDDNDPLKELKKEFLIPSKTGLHNYNVQSSGMCK
jgi:kynureninase